jgi:hypothetical protein
MSICGDENDDAEQYLRSIAASLSATLKYFAPMAKHEGTLTLEHQSLHQTDECEVVFINERSYSVDIRPRTMDHEDYESEVHTNHSPFPTFLPSGVAVPYEDPYHTFDIIPNKVFVGDQPLFTNRRGRSEA